MAASDVVLSVLAEAQAQFGRRGCAQRWVQGMALHAAYLPQEGFNWQSDLSRTIGMQAGQVLKRSVELSYSQWSLSYSSLLIPAVLDSRRDGLTPCFGRRARQRQLRRQ